MLLHKLGSMGLILEHTPEGLRAAGSGLPHAADVATLPYPGVATDYKPFLVTMLSVSDGISIVTENLFEGRFRYIDELRRMGADIRTEGTTRSCAASSGSRVRRCGLGHPRRCRAGPGGPRRRRRDGRVGRGPRRPRLRGLGGGALLAGRPRATPVSVGVRSDPEVSSPRPVPATRVPWPG